MGRSPGFASAASNSLALFRLAFATAPPLKGLTCAAYHNSLAHYAKGTPSPSTQLKAPTRISLRRCLQLSARLRLVVGIRFQVLFHSPSGVLFTFPSRYWFTIGHRIIFSLMPWSALIPTGFLVPRSTRVHKPERPINFVYRALTSSGSPFQDDSTIHRFSYSPSDLQLTPSITLYPRCTTTVVFFHAGRFRLFPFRSPLLRKSMSLSPPPGT
jgi:hypothetical protein